MAKERLDVMMTRLGISDTRERARALIMAGEVLVNGQRADKPGTLVRDDAVIRLTGKGLPYVSRGGLKLSKALEVFGIDLHGRVAADIGASTGGFTDCALQNGASKVFAIDVGYGQLAWKLRTDPRVVSLERRNARYITPEDIGEPVSFASIDVSFISLKKVLVPARDLLTSDGEIVALIKPQFEAGRDRIGKKGVVRDAVVHEVVVREVAAFSREAGLAASGLTYSPVKGPEGNIEYLIWLTRRAACDLVTDDVIHDTVSIAQRELSKK